MTQMPPDSIVNITSFRKVEDQISREKIMIAPMDAARLLQTYLVAERERIDGEESKERTADRQRVKKAQRLSARTKAKKSKRTRLKPGRRKIPEIE